MNGDKLLIFGVTDMLLGVFVFHVISNVCMIVYMRSVTAEPLEIRHFY